MKTSLKVIATALVLVLNGVSASSFAYASTDDPAKKPEKKASFAVAMFPAAEKSKVWVYLEKYNSNDKIMLELRDAKGRSVFQEMLPAKGNKRNAFRQQFDMSQIEDGTYTFHITSSNQTEDISFKLSTPTLEQQQSARLISLN